MSAMSGLQVHRDGRRRCKRPCRQKFTPMVNGASVELCKSCAMVAESAAVMPLPKGLVEVDKVYIEEQLADDLNIQHPKSKDFILYKDATRSVVLAEFKSNCDHARTSAREWPSVHRSSALYSKVSVGID